MVHLERLGHAAEEKLARGAALIIGQLVCGSQLSKETCPCITTACFMFRVKFMHTHNVPS
jgi:hypothetical protein